MPPPYHPGQSGGQVEVFTMNNDLPAGKATGRLERKVHPGWRRQMGMGFPSRTEPVDGGRSALLGTFSRPSGFGMQRL